MAVGTQAGAQVERRSAGPSSLRRFGWRVRYRVAHLPPVPLALAFVGYLASDTPSLLPRPWYFQGVIGGISALIFYVVGVVVVELSRLFARWAGLRVTIRPGAWRVLTRIWQVLLVLALVAYPFLSRSWHVAVTDYVGEPPPGPFYAVLSIVTAIVVCGFFVGIWYLISRLDGWLKRRIGRRFVRVALVRVVATVVTTLVVLAVLDQVVARGLLLAAREQADQVNLVVPAGLETPVSTFRSGGPGSLVKWQNIGADGKTFVASGPDRQRVAEVTGDAAAQEPIRLFASASKDRDLEATKDVVLAEMDRTNALQRKAILVVTSTSTGFVNEWAAESFEYLMHGDTAIVTMQYSTLPSALALLTARDEPPKVGRLLFDAVAQRIGAVPQASRPKLYVSGESLGAYGGNGAFATPEEMLAKVDGGLWTGTPSFTDLHETLTSRRSFGSTVVNPTLDDGEHIRFAGNPDELTADQFGHSLGLWKSPRVAYLQHNNDPVVWWSTDLLFTTPTWLNETMDPGTPMSNMSWLPFVTFWQVTADMAMSNTVSGGFGHRYFEEETVPAWAGVLGMDPKGDYAKIKAAIKDANEG